MKQIKLSSKEKKKKKKFWKKQKINKKKIKILYQQQKQQYQVHFQTRFQIYHKERNMNQVNNILLRILATFAASGLSVMGAGAIAGVPLWKAAVMAGIGGVAVVVEGLSRAFLDDGKLSVSEINAVFSTVDKKAKKVDSAS
jgi:Flp pilus assembly protein TadB